MAPDSYNPAAVTVVELAEARSMITHLDGRIQRLEQFVTEAFARIFCRRISPQQRSSVLCDIST